MGVLREYISSGEQPDKARLDALIEAYPWFDLARKVRARMDGEEVVVRCTVDIAKIAKVSEGEIIDRFLRKGDYRIVADQSDEVEEDVRIEAEIDEDDDIVSEELAEIYLSQGLKSQAIEIYRKLSLLNTEKSVYFAEKIATLSKE